jgi:hypothetical protein
VFLYRQLKNLVGYEQLQKQDMLGVIYKNLLGGVKSDYIQFFISHKKVINNFYGSDIKEYNHSVFLNH